MQLQVKGRNLEVSTAIRDYAQQKLSKLERQLTRSRHQGRARRRKAARASGPAAESTPLFGDEGEPTIVKTKQFAVTPITAEDAVVQLELIGHDFFVFRNADGGEVNVLYRRRDGNYGLIEPR